MVLHNWAVEYNVAIFFQSFEIPLLNVFIGVRGNNTRFVNTDGNKLVIFSNIHSFESHERFSTL